MTVVNIALSLLLIGLIFKTYQNSVLSSFLVSAALNIVFDNFVVRPVMSLILAIPLSLSSSMQEYIMECSKEV